MADVAGIVEVESPVEHDLDQAGEILGEGGARAAGRGRGAIWRRRRDRSRIGRRTVEYRGGVADGVGRVDPRQYRTLRTLDPAQVSGQQAGQAVAGVLEEARVVRGGDTLPGRCQIVLVRRHGAPFAGVWALVLSVGCTLRAMGGAQNTGRGALVLGRPAPTHCARASSVLK